MNIKKMSLELLQKELKELKQLQCEEIKVKGNVSSSIINKIIKVQTEINLRSV